MFPVFNSSVPQPMQPQPQDPEDDDDDDPTIWTASKCKSVLQFHGNERTMNINPLILTNVQGSPYFKVELFGIKTFSEVVDQIYYKVEHLEPWAVGSRKTAGRSQTGMCGGVRGVSAGGVVSSAYCLMYKLYTLKVTKKQLYALLEHCDSPYIRGVGFLFLRWTIAHFLLLPFPSSPSYVLPRPPMSSHVPPCPAMSSLVLQCPPMSPHVLPGTPCRPS